MVAFAENKFTPTVGAGQPGGLGALGVKNVAYHRYDPETEDYYVRNRYYSPALVRRIQRDPIGYGGGINLYAYIGSSPVENWDPSGLAWGYWDNPITNGIGAAIYGFGHPPSSVVAARLGKLAVQIAEGGPPPSTRPLLARTTGRGWQYIECMGACINHNDPLTPIENLGLLPLASFPKAG
jgi:RHS repeat-associated protein